MENKNVYQFTESTDLIKPTLEKHGKVIKDKLLERTEPFRKMMTFYECALMEVETKFKVLNTELSLHQDHNPIEDIRPRLKSFDSITEKMLRRGFPLSVDSMEENINDIAGIRIICGYPSDIYDLSEAFLKQDDIRLLSRKDYIKNPKTNGYRSLHLVIETPIHLHQEKKTMKVEVQFRTISMDWWATLEHKIRYKKDIHVPDHLYDRLHQELLECAEVAAKLDLRMEKIHHTVERLEKYQ